MSSRLRNALWLAIVIAILVTAGRIGTGLVLGHEILMGLEIWTFVPMVVGFIALGYKMGKPA